MEVGKVTRASGLLPHPGQTLMCESLNWEYGPCSRTERQGDDRKERKQPSPSSKTGLWLLNPTKLSEEISEMSLRTSVGEEEALICKGCVMGVW